MSQAQTDINGTKAESVVDEENTNSGAPGVSSSRSPKKKKSARQDDRPTPSQLKWLVRGRDQAGGKLPLFDEFGGKVSERTVLSCIEKGWAAPWFNNPLKPDWQVCRLTEAGRQILGPVAK